MPTHNIPVHVCQERIQLTSALAAATSELFVVINSLSAKTGEDFLAARALLSAARAVCAKTRRALADHKAQHGC